MNKHLQSALKSNIVLLDFLEKTNVQKFIKDFFVAQQKFNEIRHHYLTVMLKWMIKLIQITTMIDQMKEAFLICETEARCSSFYFLSEIFNYQVDDRPNLFYSQTKSPQPHPTPLHQLNSSALSISISPKHTIFFPFVHSLITIIAFIWRTHQNKITTSFSVYWALLIDQTLI